MVRTARWLAAGLVILTVAVFAEVRHHDFVSWDDPAYVSENAVVGKGLTAQGAAWAFRGEGGPYWHPLTWLSHMLDVELFGVDAGAHHLVNLALHLASTLALFGLLRRATGSAVPSAAAAALFAVHPLHVESVAWIAERKDVLSGCLWMLALAAWGRYAARPTRGRYAVVAGLFALGLMAKPMVVTLPVVLLLWDIWPLGRSPLSRPATAGAVAPQPWRALLVEKLPLLALSLAVAAVTLATQSSVGAVQDLASLSMGARLSNAAVAYATYLWKTVWPLPLAAYYPLTPAPAWTLAASLLTLAGVSALAVQQARTRPWLLVGWLWYVVTLLPVAGLVQVGGQAMADRFTYLPLVGVFIAVAWTIADLVGSRPRARVAAIAAVSLVVAALAAVAAAQVRTWRDSETLWQHAAAVIPGNDLAFANLGALHLRDGRPAAAAEAFAAALRIADPPEAPPQPGTRQAGFAAQLHHDLATQLLAVGEGTEAVRHFREAVRLRPGEPGFHANYASALYRSGDAAGAVREWTRAVEAAGRRPDAARWHYNLAAALAASGDVDGARRHLTAALAINPAYDPARRALDAIR